MDTSWLAPVVAVLVWPGLLGSVLLSWLYLWWGRKLTARLQGRQGPPFYQPFFDFIKLLGKRALLPEGAGRGLFYGLPAVAALAPVVALALLPLPGGAGVSFGGDLILVLFLLELPAFCTVLAGYVSRSLYGQVSAGREAVLMLGYNLPFLAGAVAVAAQVGSFRLVDVVGGAYSPVHVAAGLAFLLAMPARMRSNPFSIPNAEQEIVAGAMTEFNGPPLALFELAHGLELVALLGLFNVLFVPAVSVAGLAWLVYGLVSLALVTLLTLLAVSTARLRVAQALRFYWLWGSAAALVALCLLALW